MKFKTRGNEPLVIGFRIVFLLGWWQVEYWLRGHQGVSRVLRMFSVLIWGGGVVTWVYSSLSVH